MKKWKVLVALEYEWRIFRFYRKVINWLIKKGMKLSTPFLCFLSRKLDKHSLLVSDWKGMFERQSGKVVVFYKCDEI